MKILISGGGIAGLTLALISKKAGFVPIILEKKKQIQMAESNIGGGIGLWPPATKVMKQLQILKNLQREGHYMPQAAYYCHKGYLLAQGSNNFTEKFRVLCIQRNILMRQLYTNCKKQSIQIIPESTIQSIQSSKKGVIAHISQSSIPIEADLIVGADGINSYVRNFIQKQQKKQSIEPKHCSYTYFRAVLDLGEQPDKKWHEHSFESWGDQLRFGYVPLGRNKTFWFVAVPTQIKLQGQFKIDKLAGNRQCDQLTKKWILDTFGKWKAPIDIHKLIQITPCTHILRTDIRKIQGVEKFPWSYNNNIFIIGDAANATAPNLAQGAGLAIESAWDFVSMIDHRSPNKLQMIENFVKKRQKRAKTVQDLADLIAKIGQLQRPYSRFRNLFMISSSSMFPTIQQYIFEKVVKYSLGGNYKSLSWTPFPIKQFTNYQSSPILQKIIEQKEWDALPKATKNFRSQLFGEGTGTVTVQSRFLGRLLMLPNNMKDSNFGAYVDSYWNSQSNSYYQKWTRVFGEGQKQAVKYETYHEISVDLSEQNAKKGYILTQSINKWMKWIKFGYIIKIHEEQKHKIIKYKSNSFWLGKYKLMLPSFVLPNSEWVQEQTDFGWKFDGKIELPPILGSGLLMRYFGQFYPKSLPKMNQRKKVVTISGGTGLIGSMVAKKFHENGWQVQILTRNKQTHRQKFFYTHMHDWNPKSYSSFQSNDFKQFVDFIKKSDLIINLAGQTPGAKWTEQIKNKILQSRLDSIYMIKAALNTSNKNIPVIQASAVGIYGHRGSQILNDNAPEGHQQIFRLETLKTIERQAKSGFKNVIIVRIGHVLSKEGSLLLSLKFAAALGVRKFGEGGQYIPWVHIEDIANAMCFISDNMSQIQQKSKNGTINLSAQNHATYQEALNSLRVPQKWKLPAMINLSAFQLESILGGVSCVLLQSQRASPSTLIECGFKFRHSSFEQAVLSKDLL